MEIEEIKLKTLTDEVGNYKERVKVTVVEDMNGNPVAQFGDNEGNLIFIRMDELKRFVKAIEAIE